MKKVFNKVKRFIETRTINITRITVLPRVGPVMKF